MAKKVQIKVAGFKAVRTSAKVEAELKKQADRIAADANASSGGGYVAKVTRGRTRSRGAVITTDGKSIRDNARNNTLVKKMRG